MDYFKYFLEYYLTAFFPLNTPSPAHVLLFKNLLILPNCIARIYLLKLLGPYTIKIFALLGI